MRSLRGNHLDSLSGNIVNTVALVGSAAVHFISKQDAFEAACLTKLVRKQIRQKVRKPAST